MFCINCGTQIKDGEKFCTSCGASTTVSESVKGNVPDIVQNTRESKGLIKKLFKFLFWAGLIVLGVWLIIALGPLWIIAIILLLIFFAIGSR
jgi:uncharacterized membrane protein YvbJ